MLNLFRAFILKGETKKVKEVLKSALDSCNSTVFSISDFEAKFDIEKNELEQSLLSKNDDIIKSIYNK